MSCRRIVIAAILAILSFEAGVALGAVRPWATSAPITLDIAPGARDSVGAETVTYDSAWYGAGTSFKITVNDSEIAQRSGCGDIAWNTRRPGVYVFKKYVYKNGVLTGEPMEATFAVAGSDLVRADVAFDQNSFLYDGTEQRPRPHVMLDGDLLVEGIDYELSYEDNVNSGTAKVVIRGLGGYVDEIERTFAIVPTGVSSLDISSDVRMVIGEELLTYDSSWWGADTTVTRITINGQSRGENAGRGTLPWSPIAPGDYELKLLAYVGGVEQADCETARFRVEGENSPFELRFDSSMYLYSGEPVVPDIEVFFGDKRLTQGVDYDAIVSDNEQAGIGTVTITGVGEYSGTVQRQFRIVPSGKCRLDLTSGTRIALEQEIVAYDNLWDGDAQSSIKLRINDAQVQEATESGEYVWTPGGMGLYTLTHTTYAADGAITGEVKTVSFYVPGSMAGAEVSLSVDSCLYNGVEQRPSVSVTLDGNTLVEGLDYTVEYENCVGPGVARVVVVGMRGERIERTFRILPAGVCFLNIASGTREAEQEEKLAYDTRWNGSDNITYKMFLDGTELSAGTGTGDVTWLPRTVGDHVLAYRTYVNGIKDGEDLTASFHVAGRDLVNAMITLNDKLILYDGTPKRPTFDIVYEGRHLVEGVDYTLSYANNIESGVGIATITGIGDFVDVLSVPFTIVPAGVCSLDIQSGYRHASIEELLNYDYQWHGSVSDNTRMQVRVNDAILGDATGIGDMEWRPTEGGEYVVKLRTYVDDYLQDDAIETAYFGIPGGDLNNWTLTIALEHDVYLYDGRPKTPRVTVKTSLCELVEGVDFSVSYRNNIEIGTAMVTITGRGIYSGQVERPFRIIAPFALARQRYPWNGMVDIGLDLQDENLAACAVMLSAKDAVGGTNLTMSTIISADMTITNTTWSLSSGKIRLIWDADVDIKNDCILSNVVIEARVVNPGSLPEGYSVANGVCSIGELSLDLQHYPATLTDVTSRTITYGFQSGKNWTKDTSNKKTGTFSYKSYKIGDNASTYLTATVKGKGTFSFWWKVSSESNYDYLHYYVNNTEMAKISGTKDWAKVTIPVTSTGNTVIKWTYTKDQGVSSGSDCGWVDATWSPNTVIVTNMPSSWRSFIPRSEWIPTRTITKRQSVSYSNLWEPSAGDEAESEILIDGVSWKTNKGEGVEVWRPDSLGTYVFTHRVRNHDATIGKTLGAKFIVAEVEPSDEIVFPDGAVSLSGYSGMYDGVGHGVDASVGGGVADATIKYATSANGVFATEPPVLVDAGTMTVWCEFSAPGYMTQTNTAMVTILPREVSLTSGSANKVYDGTALVKHEVLEGGDGFVIGEGVTCECTGLQITVGESANTFTYVLNEGTKVGNYTISTVNGTLAVTKASVGGGGEEPGSGDVPEGGLSKFDTIVMYDGAGHTIDTNALAEAFGTVMIGGFVIDYALDDGSGLVDATTWTSTPHFFTNVCDESVWYRVRNPNYEDFVHAAKVTITNRSVTVASADGSWIYDGVAHSNTALSVMGFVNGEGILADSFADIVDVGTVANAFTYVFAEGTLAENYAVTCVTGTLSITAADMSGWTDDAKWLVTLAGDGAKYDGTEKTCEVTTVAYDGFDIPTFIVGGNKATDAGDYILTVTGTGNFSGSHSFPWSIAKREVTLTSGSATKVYDGTALVKHEVSVGGDGFADGEGAVATYTGSQTAVGESANTFTYTLNEGTKAGNYTITTENGTLTVTKATVGPGGGDEPGSGTVPEGGVSKFDTTAMYDGEGHTIDTNALAAAFGTAMIGESAVEYAKDGGLGEAALPWVAEAPVYTNAGEYVVWYRVTNPNYEDFTHAAKVTITNRPVTVMVTGRTATYTYDTTEKSETGCEAATTDELYDIAADTVFNGGFIETALPGVVFGGCSAVRTDVGTTAMGLTAGDFANNNANFAVTYLVTDGALTIEPRVIGDDPANWDIRLDRAAMYDGTEKTAPIIQVCYVKPDGNLDNIPYTLSGNTATDAGNYVLRITGTGNYAGYVEKEWSITPRNVTLTSGSATWIYDGAAHNQTAVSVTGDGFADGEGATYSGFPTVRHVADAATPIANAFAYALNANTKPGNYEITTSFGTVQMTPRAITLTAPTKTKQYDGQPLTFGADEITATLNGEGGATGVHALPGGEEFTLSNFASITEAGRVDATFVIADGTALMNDYAVTTVPGSLTVTRNATEITVTAKSGSWTYDGEPHTLHEYEATNLGTLLSGDELVVAFSDESVVTTPGEGPEGDGVVPNVITGVRVLRNGADDVTANYTVEWFPGTLAVTKRPVTVTVTGHTATYTYDGAEKTVTGCEATTEDTLYDITADTLFGGGVGHAALPGSVFDGCSAARSDAGKTDMGLTAGDFANNNDCFEVTYAVTDGWVKIAPADISASDEGDFVLSLGANPKYNGTVRTIPVENVTYKGLSVTYLLAGENATHAGTYTLTVKGDGNFTGERSTTWQILKRQVTLTSGSASKVYDGTALVNGSVVVGGDGFIGLEGATFDVTGSQTVAGVSKNAFTYTLKAGTLSGDYEIAKVEGDLMVTKARYPGQEPGGAGIQWNVATDAATWMYDGQSHGVTLTGVPAGVTPHLVGNTAIDAGTYTASVTFDYDAANYEPPVVPGPLAWSITKRPISLHTVNAEKPYDGFPLTVERANITPGLSGYADGECFDYFDLASITEVGETPATFGYRDSATAKVVNYAVTVVGGATLKVTVGGDQISVTARDGTWAYDGEAHRLAEWDVVNGDRLLVGHEFQIKVSDQSVVATPEDGDAGDGIVSNRFEYVRIVDAATGAEKTRNYNLFVYEGKLQITNRVICSEELRVNGEGFTERIEKVYDGVATGAVVTADLLKPATVRYLADMSASTEPPEGVWSDEPPQFTHAGNYTVWYEVTARYYDACTGKIEVAIEKRPVTLTSPTKAKPYDGAPLTFAAGEIAAEYTGGGFIETALPEGESFVFSGFAAITDAGHTDATFAYEAGAGTTLDDYEVTVVNGTLTVNASADEITVTAKSGSWPYDGAAHVLHDCEVVNGDVLQSGDELVVAYDAASVAATPDDGEAENRIVSVKVMRGGEDGEDVTRNYSIAIFPGKIRVVNATMAVDGSGFSTQATYDGEKHTVAVAAPTLLTSPVTVAYAAPGDAAWKLDPMAVGVKDAGTHTIRYRISAPYYNDFFGEATVTVAPRPVTLLSASARKVYDGVPLRANSVVVKEGSLGFVNGEGVDATCTSAQTGVGKIENGFNYEFKDGTISENYTIIPEFGWLEVTPGTLTVDVERSGYTGVYDRQPHGVTPVFSGTGLNLDACEITFALVSGDESAYGQEMPTFTDVGTYTVYVKIKAQNFDVIYTELTVTITKVKVEAPAVASKVYNGEVQIADVPASPLYQVYSNEGGREVGEHSLVLKLVDSKNYKWAPKDGVTVASSFAFMTFIITKQDNVWTVEPSIESWRTDEQAKQPIAAARYGTVTVEYKGTLANGDAYESPFSPMNPGSYVACFTVRETEDYVGLYKEVPFTVTEKTVEPINVKATGYLGIYDGNPHSITLTVTGGSGTPTVTYAKEREGTYSTINPSFTAVGIYTVWYKVVFPNFAPIEGSAVVSISKGGGGDDEYVNVRSPNGGATVRIRKTWFSEHTGFVEKFGGDFDKAATMGTGKFDAEGNEMQVWQDYVAGTDPIDVTSRFFASIEILDGKPVVRWNPALNGDRVKTGVRIYSVYGKRELSDETWTIVDDESKGGYRFFKVKVEMPKED